MVSADLAAGIIEAAVSCASSTLLSLRNSHICIAFPISSIPKLSIYKLYIINILNKNTIEFHDMIIVYGLITYVFNINFLFMK